jgi:thioredoxin-related protein
MEKTAVLLLLISTIQLTSFRTDTVKSEKNKGIYFFQGSWEEVLLKAKEEHKYIFIVFYATWCGSCKQIKKSFKDEKVGDYYNKNFINFSINGESKEGRDLMYKYKIQSYPTLLIVDFNGKVATKSVGVLKPYVLINFGRRIVP